MDSYSPYADEQQQSYQGTIPQQDQHAQVGPEWGQQFVENFFQTQPVGAAGGPSQPVVYGQGEFVNTPTAGSGAQPLSYPSPMLNQGAGAYYQYSSPSPPSSYTQRGVYGGNTMMSGSPATAYPESSYYYDPQANARALQPATATYTSPPQFQAPQYGSYAPQGGGQVYMMPPIVKKSSSHKKKKGMCC